MRSIFPDQMPSWLKPLIVLLFVMVQLAQLAGSRFGVRDA